MILEIWPLRAFFLSIFLPYRTVVESCSQTYIHTECAEKKVNSNCNTFTLETPKKKNGSAVEFKKRNKKIDTDARTRTCSRQTHTISHFVSMAYRKMICVIIIPSRLSLSFGSLRSQRWWWWWWWADDHEERVTSNMECTHQHYLFFVSLPACLPACSLPLLLLGACCLCKFANRFVILPTNSIQVVYVFFDLFRLLSHAICSTN